MVLKFEETVPTGLRAAQYVTLLDCETVEEMRAALLEINASLQLELVPKLKKPRKAYIVDGDDDGVVCGGVLKGGSDSDDPPPPLPPPPAPPTPPKLPGAGAEPWIEPGPIVVGDESDRDSQAGPSHLRGPRPWPSHHHCRFSFGAT